jgi:O-antigen/teichoic acid export membrane protein
VTEVRVASPPPGRTKHVTSGARGGALLAAGSAASIVLNYAFLLAAARALGSANYGSLGALLGLISVVVLPASALQMAISREISRHIASGDETGANALARSTLRVALIATVPLVVLVLALAVPLARVLHIHSTSVVVIAALTLATAFPYPAALGTLQGLQRFHALAAMYAVPLVVRLVVFGAAAAAGARLTGAVFAVAAGAIAANLAAIALIWKPLSAASRNARPNLQPFLRYLTPVAAGLIGIALLTHVDILIVKARLSADDAGAYAAASAFARVGFFLPATILSVIFPRTAARQARGEQTEDILGRSLLAAIGFCALLVLVYAATGRGVITMTFGPSFAQAGDVLAPFALAIGLYSIAYVLVGYDLSRGHSRYSWIVGGAVVAQVVALAVVPRNLHAVVWANVIVAASAVVAHEVFVGSSAPALRAGLRHFSGIGTRVRAVLPEAGLVLLGSTVFVCALYWPVIRHFGSTIIGSPGSDSTGSVAAFWQMHREGGFHILGTTHHTMTGAPFGWSDTSILNLQLLLPYYPTYLASLVIGPVAAYNLITLAGYALSGASMYLLVRYLGCRRFVATWAALAFIVFPFHIAHEEHASLLHLECLVVLFIALIALVRRPSWLRVGFVAAANLGCWLMSGYFGPMAFITTVAFAGAVALAWRSRAGLVLLGESTAAAVVGGGIVGLATVASGANAGLGLARLPIDLSILGIHPFDLLVPSVGNLLLGHDLDSFWLRHLHGSNVTEASNYLGLLTIALAIGWLVRVYRRGGQRGETTLETATVGLAGAFVVGLLFALPSPLLGFSMPSRLLWHFISAFHVPSRWDFLLMTALVPLAALGLQALSGRLSRRNAVLAYAVVGAAMVISFFELTIHPARPRWRTVPVPAEYTAVKETPNGILAEYPLGYSDIYGIWQRVHGRPLLDNAPAGSAADNARMMVIDPAEPGTAQALATLGVTAITFDPHGHADTPVPPREPTAADGYRLVTRAPDGVSVWDVVATPEPAFSALAGFGPPQRTPQGFIGYTFDGSAGVGAIDIAARAPTVARLSFVAIPPAGKSSVVGITDTKQVQAVTLQGRTHVSLVVAIPRGQSQILLKTNDSIVVSAPQAATTTAQPTLHANLISASPGF